MQAGHFASASVWNLFNRFSIAFVSPSRIPRRARARVDPRRPDPPPQNLPRGPRPSARRGCTLARRAAARRAAAPQAQSRERAAASLLHRFKIAGSSLNSSPTTPATRAHHTSVSKDGSAAPRSTPMVDTSIEYSLSWATQLLLVRSCSPSALWDGVGPCRHRMPSGLAVHRKLSPIGGSYSIADSSSTSCTVE